MGRIKEVYMYLTEIVEEILSDEGNIVSGTLDDYVKLRLEHDGKGSYWGFYQDVKEQIIEDVYMDTGLGLDMDESETWVNPKGGARYVGESFEDPGNITPATKNYYECLRIASELLEAGLDPYEIDDEMEHMLSSGAYEYWLENKAELLADLDVDDQENYFEDAQFPKDDDEEDWVDPAGGTHHGYEEDPAKMYEVLVGKEKQQERFIDLRGPSGNAYVIMGMAKTLANQLKQVDPKKYNWETIQAEMTAGNYNNLVHTFERYFGDYVTIYGADVLDPQDDEDVDENCSESLDEMYIIPLLSEGNCCGGIKPKPKPRPKPRPGGRLHEIASKPPTPPADGKPNTLLEDNSGDLQIVAARIAANKLDEKYIIPKLK